MTNFVARSCLVSAEVVSCRYNSMSNSGVRTLVINAKTGQVYAQLAQTARDANVGAQSLLVYNLT